MDMSYVSNTTHYLISNIKISHIGCAAPFWTVVVQPSTNKTTLDRWTNHPHAIVAIHIPANPLHNNVAVSVHLNIFIAQRFAINYVYLHIS